MTVAGVAVELLRGELERVFELDDMKRLSVDLLGLSPDDVGGANGKGTFARALVDRCTKDESLSALAEAMLLSGRRVDSRVQDVASSTSIAAQGEELAAATVVGNYRLQRKLGESTTSVVYLVEALNGQQPGRAALRVVRKDWSRDRGAVRRFLTVSRALTAEKPTTGVAAPIAVGELPDGRPWVLSPFQEGTSLANRLTRIGPMHSNELRSVIRPIATALDLLHKRGIAHGAIKPENVFVSRAGGEENKDGKGESTGILVDAGTDRLFARARGDVPTLLAAHVAPEVLRGKPLDARAEVFSLGVLAYQALTAKSPFAGETPIDVVASKLSDEPQEPSKLAPRGFVTRDIDSAVLRALSKDPAARFATASEFVAALDAASRASKAPPSGELVAYSKEAWKKAADALRARPDNEDVALELEHLSEAGNVWGETIPALEAALAAADSVDTKKALLFRMARIQEAELKNPAAVEAVYERVLEIDAEDEIARIGIEELRRSSGNTEGLVESLLEKVERASTATQRAAILNEIAILYETQLKNEDSVFVAWTQALSEDPHDERAAREIVRMASGNNERWTEALGTVTDAAQSTDDPRGRLALHTLAGGWYAEHLHRSDLALASYNQALVIDPAYEPALEGTIDIYRRAQAWSDLVTLMLRRADTAQSGPKARDLRASAAEVVYDRMGEADRAVELAQRVLKDDPTHGKALEVLELVLAKSNKWAELAAALDLKSHNERGEGRIETLNQLGELYEARLNNPTRGAIQFEAALALDPMNMGALKGLERIWAKNNKFDKLLENLQLQLEAAATPKQRIGLLDRIGGLLEEEFVNAAEAAVTYEKIVEIDPGHDGANSALERIYRKLERFDALAETYDRHARGSSDDRRKVELLLQSAKVLVTDVGAPDRARHVCERVLALDPKSTEALDLKARLTAQSGDANAAVEAIEKLAEAETDVSKRAELFVRAGGVLEERGDSDGAIDRYKEALDLDSKSLTAATALRKIYAKRGDALGSAELLTRQLDVTSGANAKAKLLAELGTLCREQLDDNDRARDAFRRALELDPTCTPAARGLGQLAAKDGEWLLVTKYLEPLLARQSELSADDMVAVAVDCGDAFREQKMFEKAQRAYANAKAFAPERRDVLERLAEVTFEGGEPAEAAELYRDFLSRFEKDLVPSERGEVLYRIGEAARRSKNYDVAIPLLASAADLLPTEGKVLQALVATHEGRGAWGDVIKTYERRMETASDDERFDLIVKIGELRADKLKDRSGASKAFVSALDMRADDRNVLTKLMSLYSEAKDWSRLVEVILRIAELVQEPAQLGRYYLTAASINNNELQRYDVAADYYEQAIENDPTLKKAFDGLVVCLGRREEWDRLAAAYRAHIRRVESSSTPEQLAALWDALAETYQNRLEEPASAIEAYEEAQKLDPTRQRTEVLADLYAQDPERYVTKAVRAHGSLLATSAYRVESYQALRKLYTEVKRADESFCACQALVALNMADPEEETFFKKHRSRSPAPAKERFTEELWLENVVHPGQDRLLTQIFASLSPAVIASRSQKLAAFGVDASNRRDPQRDSNPMAQMLHYAAGVTDITMPDVYSRDADPTSLSFLFSAPPAIGLGKGALAKAPPQALAFVAGRHLSYFRNGHFVRHIVPTGAGLRAWLLAAIRLVSPQFPVSGGLENDVATHMQALRTHLQPPQQEAIKSLVHKLLAEAPELNMRKWVAAVDMTADRVGFVLASDLEICMAVVRASAEDAAAVAQKDRLSELMTYSVSAEYLALRKALKVTI